MAGKFTYFRQSSMILLLILVLQSAIAKRKSKDDNQKELLVEYAAFEAQVHETVTSMFSRLEVEETCEVGDPNCDPVAAKLPEEFQSALMSLLARVDNLDDILGELLPVVTELTSQRSQATVPNDIVSPKLNANATLSCESDDKPLSLCIWGKIVNGKLETIVIDDDVIKNGGKTEADGISYEGEGLAGGKCGLKIQAVRVKDIGTWFCTLITNAGPIFTGEVVVQPQEAIYFATSGAGIKAYAPLTSAVNTVVSSNESCYGIAYDSIQNKIYWSTLTEYKIFRANIDGSQVETVWNTTTEYAFFQGLAFDWITGNLYVGTRDGNVSVCDTSASRSFTCHLLLTGRGDVDGLTLNPINGSMYWTSFKVKRNASSIWKGGMDGRFPSKIIGGLENPRGIVIDFKVSRLYWADVRFNEIQSSDLDGNDVRTVLQNLERPFGIAVIGDRLFWGAGKDNNQLHSSSRKGIDMRTHHNGTNQIRYLTLVPDLGHLRNLRNPCAGRHCSGICVLTTNSSRCLN